jgi:hypothetical protein
VSPVADLVAATLLRPSTRPPRPPASASPTCPTARHGCKGPGAAAWLESLGLPIPPAPNSWLPLDGGGLIARLGFTEFLIEGPDALIAPRRRARGPACIRCCARTPPSCGRQPARRAAAPDLQRQFPRPRPGRPPGGADLDGRRRGDGDPGSAQGLPARASGATAPMDITCGKPCSASPSSWAAAPLPPQLQLNRPNPTQHQESGNDAHRSQAVSRRQRRQVCAGPVCRHPRHGQDQGRSGRPFRQHPHHRRRLCGLRGVGPRHRAQRPGLHGHRRPGHSPWCPGSPATPASPATAT